MENYDPLDTEQNALDLEDAATQRKLALETEVADFKWLMSGKRGRRVVWRLMSESGVFNPVFDSSAMQMAFNEGRRNAGLKLLSQVHLLTPELYSTMMQEQQQ